MAVSGLNLGTLDGTSGFRLNGASADDHSGRSVASAGDVNGDGYDDLIVGARYADPNGNGSGASYVVFGKASGFAATLALSTLDGTTGFRLDGAATRDESGVSVASAGDVNGDGYDDLIVGARFADPNGTSNAGASYVVFGKASGFAATLALSTLDGTTGFRMDGAAVNDRASSVASAGDVNGDGYDDLIVGAEFAGPNDHPASGSSYVVFGKASGFAATLALSTLDGTTGFRMDGAAELDYSGESVASAGDVNGDGYDDLIVGAWGADPNGTSRAGSSYVVFGKASGFAATLGLGTLDGTTGLRLDGAAAEDHSGVSVASAGDVNGDGYADLIVGARRADPNGGDSGATYVVFGKASGFAATLGLGTLDGTTGFRLAGARGDQSGSSVSSAGDVNGDGYDDLIVGARYADPNANLSGASYVVFGKASGFLASIVPGSLDGTTGFQLSGTAANDWSGYSVASAGDVNGDGYADLIVGAPLADPNGGNSGSSYVVFGRSGLFTTGDADPNTLTGGASDDALYGLGGDDTLDGMGGHDTLNGGAGADTMTGGAGNDIYHVDDAGDVVVEAAAGGTDTVKTTLASFTLADHVERLQFVGTGAFTGTGNSLDNLLTGGSGNDTLDGGAGSDLLRGAEGTDQMTGGSGNDTYQVDDAGDVVVELTGGGTDTVKTTLASYTLGDHVERVQFRGTGDFTGTGNGLDNVLKGGDGDDTLDGLGGHDTLIGGAGADTMTGGGGNDIYLVDDAGDVVIELAGGGIDTVKTTQSTYTLGDHVERLQFVGTGAFAGTGNALDNLLRGGDGNDTLEDDTGDDTLVGGAGADQMTGGAGDDTYLVDDAGDVVIELAGGGIDTVKTTLSSYTLGDNVDRLQFVGTGAFAGTGNVLDNLLWGGDGDDTLEDDTGNDTLIGGSGADTMTGGAGNDIYQVDDVGDVVVEAAAGGIDTVETTLSTYTLGDHVERLKFVGTGAFAGTGNALDNLLRGDSGDDMLVGGAGADQMTGEAGNDTYQVDDAGDVVIEARGGGIDTVETMLSTYTLGDHVERLEFVGTGTFTGTGNGLANVLGGGDGDDALDGLGGHDSLNGGVGADTMTGGAGNDTYHVDDAGDVVVEAAAGGIDTVETTLSTYTLGDHVERLQFVGAGDFTGIGNTLDNMLKGGDGDDTLEDDTGNDTLNGGTGADTMTGGAGNDTYHVDDAGDVVVEAAAGGIDTVETTLSTYTLGDNVERLRFVGTGDFAGTGNALDNLLWGGDGDDTLEDDTGNDTLNGGTGADTMTGGAGNDTYHLDDAGDVVVEAAAGGVDTVKTTLSTYTLGDNVERLQFEGTGAFAGTGNALDNLLRGGDGNDTLEDDTGDDMLIGGVGADTMTGGAGDDTYFVDDAGDVIVEATGEGSDTVRTTLASYGLADNVEILRFDGIGPFTGTGNALANTISGGTGNDMLNGGLDGDTLRGGAGNDVLIGGAGADKLVGGAGADVFVFLETGDSTRASRDTILDFTVGTDVIGLTQIGEGFQALQTVTSAPATIGAHSLVAFVMGNGNTVLYANNTDAALSTESASMEIVLKGVTTLGDADLDYLVV